MKIAIPVDEKSWETTVCQSFGRAPYYLIYETETRHHEFKVNEAASSSGGAGVKAAQLIVDEKIDTVLTPRCGENSAEVLIGAGIQILRTAHALAKDNIRAFLEGKLLKLEEIHGGYHRHGRQ
ncbi:MAG TPA: NifB/NifX family molybdenum-iron cluster-binding protein [Bacillota bacterium]|nr:NifB/NifX family molybdenum-iron cluster-binding protein [Bacillota bacterium]